MPSLTPSRTLSMHSRALIDGHDLHLSVRGRLSACTREREWIVSSTTTCSLVRAFAGAICFFLSAFLVPSFLPASLISLDVLFASIFRRSHISNVPLLSGPYFDENKCSYLLVASASSMIGSMLVIFFQFPVTTNIQIGHMCFVTACAAGNWGMEAAEV